MFLERKHGERDNILIVPVTLKIQYTHCLERVPLLIVLPHCLRNLFCGLLYSQNLLYKVQQFLC